MNERSQGLTPARAAVWGRRGSLRAQKSPQTRQPPVPASPWLSGPFGRPGLPHRRAGRGKKRARRRGGGGDPGAPPLAPTSAPLPRPRKVQPRSPRLCHASRLQDVRLEAKNALRRRRGLVPKPRRPRRWPRARGPSSPGPPLPAGPAAAHSRAPHFAALVWEMGFHVTRARPCDTKEPQSGTVARQPSEDPTPSSAKRSSGPGRKSSLRGRKPRLPA